MNNITLNQAGSLPEGSADQSTSEASRVASNLLARFLIRESGQRIPYETMEVINSGSEPTDEIIQSLLTQSLPDSQARAVIALNRAGYREIPSTWLKQMADVSFDATNYLRNEIREAKHTAENRRVSPGWLLATVSLGFAAILGGGIGGCYMNEQGIKISQQSARVRELDGQNNSLENKLRDEREKTYALQSACAAVPACAENPKVKDFMPATLTKPTQPAPSSSTPQRTR